MRSTSRARCLSVSFCWFERDWDALQMTLTHSYSALRVAEREGVYRADNPKKEGGG